MSLLALIANQQAGGGTTPNPTPAPRFPLDGTGQVIVDGNSISANHGSRPTLANLLAERLGGDGLLVTNAATNGETWQIMVEGGEITPAQRRDTNRPFLAVVMNETTNSIRTGRGVESTQQDILDYTAMIRATWPWAVIIAWPALPVGHGDDTAYPLDRDRNHQITQINDWMAANQSELSIDVWADLRTAIPQYNHDGNEPEPFRAYATAWQEQEGSTSWQQFGWLHPDTGTWPTTGPGTGKRAIAAHLAELFATGQIPATH